MCENMGIYICICIYVCIDMQDSKLYMNALLCGFCWSFLPTVLP